MPALICGSLAFDTIMTFEGRFAEQIMPEQLHILNVSFLVPALRREFGGCAGNIAYSLTQLGGNALPMATVGNDGMDYVAQAMIMTDRDNNQITAFHPGAMSQAHLSEVAARHDIKIGIISPDGRDAMLQHAAQFKAAGIPFVFDPGQGLPMFNGDELTQFVELATWVTVNDYEGRMLSERTGLDKKALSRRVEGLVVTLGAEGCEVWVDGAVTLVAPVKAIQLVDPTGCGDAFRGALLFGLEKGWSLAKCCELGNRVGAHKIATPGCQNYTLETIRPA
jgi:adenosine kinase